VAARVPTLAVVTSFPPLSPSYSEVGFPGAAGFYTGVELMVAGFNGGGWFSFAQGRRVRLWTRFETTLALQRPVGGHPRLGVSLLFIHASRRPRVFSLDCTAWLVVSWTGFTAVFL